MSDNPTFRDLIEQARAATAQMAEATREQREARHAFESEYADVQKKIEARRRNGDMGRDWQVLQQRIDLNQTTFADILNGVDTSSEARAVRLVIQREFLPRARAQFADAVSSEQMASQLDNLHLAQAQLQEALASFQRMGGGR